MDAFRSMPARVIPAEVLDIDPDGIITKAKQIGSPAPAVAFIPKKKISKQLKVKFDILNCRNDTEKIINLI